MAMLNRFIAPLLLAGLAAATPAIAQDKPYRDRPGSVAGEIAREIEEAADAIGTVTDAVSNSVNGYRYRRAERFAISRCAPRLERYGKMRVERVAPYGRRSVRVYGFTEASSWERSRYERSAYPTRAFTCTVRNDGRVRLDTRRIRA